ncbi:MAG: DUF222 domain-containing protein [Actinomycetes bacterium]
MLPAPALSAPVADVLDAARALALAVSKDEPAQAGQVDVPTTPEDRAAWLVGTRQIIDAVEVAFTYVLADFDAAGDGQVLHAAASTQSWLRGALGMASMEASERVRIARGTRSELAPALALVLSAHHVNEVTDSVHDSHDDSVDDSSGTDDDSGDAADVESDLLIRQHPEGRVSYDHVRSIHRTLRALPPSERGRASETLTGLAPQLGVDDLRATGRYLRHVIDPDGSARQAEEDYRRRWLSIAPMLDGMHSIDGVLDAETAGRLNAALAPFLVPSGPDDVRTTDQRRADGLAEVVDAAVRSGDLPWLSGSSVALQVDVPLVTLTGDAPEPARLSATTKTPVWFTPDAAQRMACDASVRRLLLDANGVPLDLGRESRVFSSVQRKALAARDGGCRFPSCGRPAVHTDGHHVIPWAQGGATDLANGVLLCRFHHRQVHEGGWRISADSGSQGANGLLTFIGPAGQRLRAPVPTARGPSP